MTSTIPTRILYLAGYLASSMMGITFVLFLAIFNKSLPLLGEHSTTYTKPVYKEKNE